MGRQMLESLGYTVTARTGSVDALADFRARPDAFDLVMTDMTMPRMTGADLSREILKIRPDIPIVLCTGFSETIRENSAKAIGIREFVLKPVVLKDLAHIIRRALALSTAGNGEG
jgi:CheY-like chemotaxis protein